MKRGVDLVRLPAEDDGADTAADIATRTVASAFPTEHKKLKKVDEETIAKVLGNKSRQFFSERELEEQKQEHGERLENGTFAGKTLREALLANKEEKESKFQEQMKQIKQGKNKPLEPDELAFLDELATEEQKRRTAVVEGDAAALKRFKQLQDSAGPGGIPCSTFLTTGRHSTSKAQPAGRQAQQPCQGGRQAGSQSRSGRTQQLRGPTGTAYTSAGTGGICVGCSRLLI